MAGKCAKESMIPFRTLLSLLPYHDKVAVLCHTILEIHIDQRLIWNSEAVGLLFEIADDVFVEIDGDRFFCGFCIWILSWIQVFDIVFFAHTITSLKLLFIDLLFGFGCFPCRDYPYDIFLTTVTVTDNADSFFKAHAND